MSGNHWGFEIDADGHTKSNICVIMYSNKELKEKLFTDETIV